MSDVCAPLAGLSVLIVEDEPLVALMLEDYAKDLGCRFAATATRVDVAQEMVEKLSPDLVVLDVLMTGGKPDFTVADDLAMRQIPFIFCSGYTPDVVAERHRQRPFLSKPFSQDDLLAAIAGCNPAGPPANAPSQGLGQHSH